MNPILQVKLRFDNERNTGRVIGRNLRVRARTNVKKIELLPYHNLGEEKYNKLNIPYPYKGKENMSKDKSAELYKIFCEEFNDSYKK